MKKLIKLKWTKIDIIMIIPTLIISLFLSSIPLLKNINNEQLMVNVYYDSSLLINIDLYPNNYTSDPRYIILYKNQKNDIYKSQYPTNYFFENLPLLVDDLIIKISNGNVQIVKETSPNNICSKQGKIAAQSPPLICAPNYVMIIIKNQTNYAEEIIL